MNVRNIRLLFIALIVGLVAAPALADGIALTTTVEKRLLVSSSQGTVQERFVPVDKVVPGDVVAYTIEAKNGSTEPADRVVITDPIPEHMRYVEGSGLAKDANLLFSIDGGFRFDSAEKLSVQNVDGTTRPASAADYTHIRWVFATPIAPDAERAVRFLAQLQ